MPLIPRLRDLAYEGARRALAIVDAGITYAAQVAGIALLLLAVLITWTVLSRKVGGPIPPAIDEIGGMTVAVGSTWVLAWGLKTKGHIRIDIVYRYFPVAWRGVLNVLALTLMVVFAVFITWRAWAVVTVSAERGAVTISELTTPLMWPQGFWAAGFSFFALYALLLWIVAVFDLLGRRLDELASRHGPEMEDSEKALLTGIGDGNRDSEPADGSEGR